VSRLVKHYDGIQVTRDESNQLLWRIVATGLRAESKGDDFGGLNPIVATGFTHKPPNCS
jgi:hypothetical protein